MSSIWEMKARNALLIVLFHFISMVGDAIGQLNSPNICQKQVSKNISVFGYPKVFYFPV